VVEDKEGQEPKFAIVETTVRCYNHRKAYVYLSKGSNPMGQTLSAVYEHGSLRLLEPVDLAESSEVRVQILVPITDWQTEAFKRLLASLQALLLRFEKEPQGDLVRTVFLQILQTDLQALWDLSQPPHRMLCTLLQLAARRLQAATLRLEQVAAFRFVLAQMTLPTVTDEDIRLCVEQLASAGVPTAFTYSAEIVQSYVDEL
jgi:predicted DNA-binding antitoxin AbrB/MazE fold protein